MLLHISYLIKNISWIRKLIFVSLDNNSSIIIAIIMHSYSIPSFSSCKNWPASSKTQILMMLMRTATLSHEFHENREIFVFGQWNTTGFFLISHIDDFFICYETKNLIIFISSRFHAVFDAFHGNLTAKDTYVFNMISFKMGFKTEWRRNDRTSCVQFLKI